MKSTYLIFTLVLGVASSALAERTAIVPERQSVKIIQTFTPSFPLDLAAQGYFEGEARIAVSIDDAGKLSDWLVIGYTHRRFADEAVQAIKQWEYEPARVQGKAVPTRFEMRVTFESTKTVISCDARTSGEIFAHRLIRTRLAYDVCTLKELDRIPIPLKTVAPAYPANLAKQEVRGNVTVDFFIDETGNIRMPAIVGTDGNELSPLAIEALLQWKFEPPTRHEQPVLVRAQQMFAFGLKKP